MTSRELAVLTVVHRGTLRFLRSWFRSIRAQTDENFDLWMVLDEVPRTEVIEAIGEEPQVFWRQNREGDTPAQLRQHAMSELVSRYLGIVLVDSDDVMLPTRVASARTGLETHDVVGCSLLVMDQDEVDRGIIFGPQPDDNWWDELDRINVFGLSNTSYRSSMLTRCLPVPARCALIDWHLITRAWDLGARVGFDYTPRMRYRQYAGNTASVLPPFSEEIVWVATTRVLGHYATLLAEGSAITQTMRTRLGTAANRARQFAEAFSGSAVVRDQYLDELNQLPQRYVWWWSVANPQLEHLWNP